MLKLNANPIKEGTRLYLPEKWHKKLVSLGKICNCPYDYIVAQTYKDTSTKETYYICEGEKNKKIKIAVEESVLKYLTGEELTDSNLGLSFKDFLPLENSKLLITNIRDSTLIVPGILTLIVGSLEIDSKNIPTLAFRIQNMNNNDLSSIRYFSEGNRKSTWKLLFNDDVSSMSHFEKTFKDTIIHKGYVQKSCEILCRYLEKEHAYTHAKMLRERALIHDNSKLSNEDELHALSRIIDDQSTMKDAKRQLSPIQKDSIELHQKHNSHHPEFFESYLDMTKLDIMEMCCDWHARSMQKGTNFLEYVKTAQETRFHFPDWMFAEIWHYCKVLDLSSNLNK